MLLWATIGTEQVSVLETGLLGLRAWRSSLSGYRGIAHHVRATAGVVTHEIILVHERADRSVLLHTAPMVAQSSIEHYSTLLRLPVITSRDVYRLRLPRWDLSGLQAVRSGLAWQRGA